MQKSLVGNEVLRVIPIERLLCEDTSLSMFQKTLMITDGTVTDLLKLYTHNRIIVKKIHQEMLLSGSDYERLCVKDTPVLKREILLGTSEENYIYADSIFIYENMSRSIQYQLLETDKPIGLLWKGEKLDTFREIIEICEEKCGRLSPYFGVEEDTLFLARTYMIYNNQKVLGMITEKFPITYFREDEYDRAD